MTFIDASLTARIQLFHQHHTRFTLFIISHTTSAPSLFTQQTSLWQCSGNTSSGENEPNWTNVTRPAPLRGLFNKTLSSKTERTGFSSTNEEHILKILYVHFPCWPHFSCIIFQCEAVFLLLWRLTLFPKARLVFLSPMFNYYSLIVITDLPWLPCGHHYHSHRSVFPFEPLYKCIVGEREPTAPQRPGRSLEDCRLRAARV